MHIVSAIAELEFIAQIAIVNAEEYEVFVIR